MRSNQQTLLYSLIFILIVLITIAAGMGAISIAPTQFISILAKNLGIDIGVSFTDQQEAVLLSIRLPRVCLAVLIGASLAVSGAMLQGLFSNPLADPGLIGISSGGTLGVVAWLVLGNSLFSGSMDFIGIYTIPIASFITALITSILVFRLSGKSGKTAVSSIILMGMAINAIVSALTGFIIFFTNDAQLRTITFWATGSLGGANWNNVIAVSPFILIPLMFIPLIAKSLNIMSLGEANASFMGVKTEKLKKIIIILTALSVGASVSVAGIIAFVGLVVPHIVRIFAGPDNRIVLPASALLGASLLLVADLISRMILQQSEIPIGIITSLIGSPFFLYILWRNTKSQISFT